MLTPQALLEKRGKHGGGDQAVEAEQVSKVGPEIRHHRTRRNKVRVATSHLVQLVFRETLSLVSKVEDDGL